MELGALLASAGINIGVFVAFLSCYSILRKQPTNLNVYFPRRLVAQQAKYGDPFCFTKLVPSAGWIMKAWTATDEDLLAIGGVDCVVFLRIVIFSMRIFSVAAMICIFLVLPVNYYGQDIVHKNIHAESLDVFSIANVKRGSKWIWIHCLALYIISFSACVLLYFEYKFITKLRLAHFAGVTNPSHFTVLVRGIPWSSDHSYSELVERFFSTYYPSSYMSHQMVYRRSTIKKLLKDAERMYRKVKFVEPSGKLPCSLCGGTTSSFKRLSVESKIVENKIGAAEVPANQRQKERPVAFVFFRTRYAAVVAAQVLQSPNPMLWVTEQAPQPHDVHWANLAIPYRQIWLRKLAILVVSAAFMFIFLIPVTFVQGLTELDQLSRTFPFLKEHLKKKLAKQVVTGYLPSTILSIFLVTVPPIMLFLATLEGNISRSSRKASTCFKVLHFTIWNVFFVNILSGSIIRQLSVFTSVKDIPMELARQVPSEATFFITYVLSYGWVGLGLELIQLLPFLLNLFKRVILRKREVAPYSVSFPYHTEIPRLVLFGLLGFTYSVLAPLMLPFLLVYFFLAYLIYRNQILNVYVMKYDSGGQYWPMVHNTTIFSLVLTQIIAIGIFSIKQSPVSSAVTIPLIFLTLLFNEYCRQRFHSVYTRNPAQVLIEMDRNDDRGGKMEEIYEQLHKAYTPVPSASEDVSEAESSKNQSEIAVEQNQNEIPIDQNQSGTPVEKNQSEIPIDENP